MNVLTEVSQDLDPLHVDGDGVVFDLIHRFTPFAEERLGRKLDPAGPDAYDMSNWLGTDHAGYVQLIKDFIAIPEAGFGHLPAMPGVVAALRAAKAQGRIITMLTACAEDEDVHERRHENTRNLLGNLVDNIHFIALHGCKADALQSYPKGIWVEDRPEYAMNGVEAGHRSYLIRHSYNRHQEPDPQFSHPLLTWVDGWDDIRRLEGF